MTYAVDRTDTGWSLRVALDDAWLDDPARVWPIRVDPSFVILYGGGDRSTFVSSAGPYANHFNEGRAQMYVGNSADNGNSAAYLDWDLRAGGTWLGDRRDFGLAQSAYVLLRVVHSHPGPAVRSDPAVDADWPASDVVAGPGVRRDPAVRGVLGLRRDRAVRPADSARCRCRRTG